jgi:hypothetical protein
MSEIVLQAQRCYEKLNLKGVFCKQANKATAAIAHVKKISFKKHYAFIEKNKGEQNVHLKKFVNIVIQFT